MNQECIIESTSAGANAKQAGDIATKSVGSLAVSTLLFNPIIFIQFIDILQMFKYLQFIDIEYPGIVVEFF